MKSNLKNILLVEDDLNFGAILNDFLNLHSYNVVLAKNGIEGLEKFKKNMEAHKKDNQRIMKVINHNFRKMWILLKKLMIYSRF